MRHFISVVRRNFLALCCVMTLCALSAPGWAVEPPRPRDPSADAFVSPDVRGRANFVIPPPQKRAVVHLDSGGGWWLCDAGRNLGVPRDTASRALWPLVSPHHIQAVATLPDGGLLVIFRDKTSGNQRYARYGEMPGNSEQMLYNGLMQAGNCRVDSITFEPTLQGGGGGWATMILSASGTYVGAAYNTTDYMTGRVESYGVVKNGLVAFAPNGGWIAVKSGTSLLRQGLSSVAPEISSSFTTNWGAMKIWDVKFSPVNYARNGGWVMIGGDPTGNQKAWAGTAIPPDLMDALNREGYKRYSPLGNASGSKQPKATATANTNANNNPNTTAAGNVVAANQTTRLPFPMGSKGRASIIISGYDDGNFATFFQERARLDRATYGYAKVVLLRPTAQTRLIEPIVERQADYKAEPTKENLVKYLKYLTGQGYTIDVWVHSHGGRGGATLHDSKGKSFKLTSDIVESLPAETGFAKLPLGLVYHVSCWGAELAPSWVKIGANCAVGPRGLNFYPTQFSTFAGEWNDGKSAQAAQDRANSSASRQLIQKYFLAKSIATRGEWGGAAPKTIITDIGIKPKKFFDYHFGFSLPEWDLKATGAHNMGMGSEFLYAGDRNFTKKTLWRDTNASTRTNILQ